MSAQPDLARELLAAGMGITAERLGRHIKYHAGGARCSVDAALRAITAALQHREPAHDNPDFAAGMERAAEIAEKELRRLARRVKGTGGDDDCAAARAWTAHRIAGAIRRAAKTPPREKE